MRVQILWHLELSTIFYFHSIHLTKRIEFFLLDLRIKGYSVWCSFTFVLNVMNGWWVEWGWISLYSTTCLWMLRLNQGQRQVMLLSLILCFICGAGGTWNEMWKGVALTFELNVFFVLWGIHCSFERIKFNRHIEILHFLLILLTNWMMFFGWDFLYWYKDTGENVGEGP